MAVVRLSDAVIPLVYESYMTVNIPELTNVWSSGLIATSDVLNTIARQGGKTGVIPFWKDIDPTVEPNASNDDPADLATPQKIGSGTMNYRKSWLNQGWADMDLVTELAGSDPMRHIASRTDTYWARQAQRRLVATIKGVIADNIANDNSDMGLNISALTGGDEIINADVVIDATYTMGDMSGDLTMIITHSKVVARWLKDDQIVYIPDSTGTVQLPYYKGYRVIVDDSMIYSGSGATTNYLTVIAGPGAIGFGGGAGHLFAFGEGMPKTPVEIDRTPEAGNGGGMETLWERKTWIIHPLGFEWIEGTLAEQSPMLADLVSATHWSRVVDRKQVPMAFIISRV